jgi:hypothetical protein
MRALSAVPFVVAPLTLAGIASAEAGAADDLHGEAQLGGVVAGGMLPSVATGFTVNEGLVAGSSWLELGGTLMGPREASVDGGRGASFSLVLLAGRLCPYARQEPGFLLLTCAGVEGGVMMAHGFGFGESVTTRRPALFVSGSLEGSARLVGPLWLGLRLSGEVPLLRDQFVFKKSNGQDVEIYRMNDVGGSVALSLGVRF